MVERFYGFRRKINDFCTFSVWNAIALRHSFLKGVMMNCIKNMKFLPNVILMLSLWKNIVYQNCWAWWMRLCILTSCTKQTIHSKNQEIKEKGKKSHVARRYTFTEKIRTLTFSVTNCNYFRIGAFHLGQFLRWYNQMPVLFLKTLLGF